MWIYKLSIMRTNWRSSELSRSSLFLLVPTDHCSLLLISVGFRDIFMGMITIANFDLNTRVAFRHILDTTYDFWHVDGWCVQSRLVRLFWSPYPIDMYGETNSRGIEATRNGMRQRLEAIDVLWRRGWWMTMTITKICWWGCAELSEWPLEGVDELV